MIASCTVIDLILSNIIAFVSKNLKEKVCVIKLLKWPGKDNGGGKHC